MNDATNDPKETGADSLLSLDEAVRFLDTSKSTLYRLLGQGEIKGVKVGKQWRFRKPDLVAYIERSPGAAALDPAAWADVATEIAWLDDAAGAYGGLPEPGDPTVEALGDRLLRLAVLAKASDLHLEPTAAGLWLRFRIDGVLHEIRRLPMGLHEPLIARFKAASGMSVAERRLPQDGRTNFDGAGERIDIRMSVVPTLRGESVVARLFRRDAVLLRLEALGEGPREFAALRPRLERAGLVLIAGAAGSGRTTALYACAQEIDAERKKVLSVEEPPEHALPGVSQIAVNRRLGLTFAAAMRCCSRQDPDVLLCGTANDPEAMDVALNAALTGHLVLAGFAAQDAAGAVRRLVDLGMESYRVASGLSAVVATRLVRRLDPATRVVADDEETFELLERLRPLAERGGYAIPDGAVFYAAPKDPRPGGGYAGRLGLYEVLVCTPKLVRDLLSRASPEAAVGLAVGAGMRTFLADGMRKAARGLTSIDEVLRATETRL